MQPAQIATAQRLLARHGALTTFRLAALTKVKATGSVTEGAVTEVQALAAILPLAQSADRQIDVDEAALYVEGPPFAAAGAGDLSETWKVVIAGAEHAILGPIAAARTVPGEAAAYYVAKLATGGEGG